MKRTRNPMGLARKSLFFALFAFLAGAPSPALAGKKAPTALTIEIIGIQSTWAGQVGTFRASGAISDHGSARMLLDYGYAQQILLEGADGQLRIVIDNIVYAGGDGTGGVWTTQLSGTCTAVAGNGAYVSFVGAAGAAAGTLDSYPRKCRKGVPDCADRKPAQLNWTFSLSS